MRGLVVSTKYKGNIEVTFPIIMCSKGIVLIESSDSSVVVKEGSERQRKRDGSAGQELGIL
jgi:hypothetical protein